MITESDLAYLHEAVALAERGLFTTTPNPRVGCVIVRDGLVLGRGWHRWPGQAHAEINALRDAGGDVAGATVYVSLEPCTVYGRTPPCVDALVAAGVKRVVAGASDPDSRVNGRGFERLGAAGIECEKFRPHCMLLDMHLGDVKGEDILKLVRSNSDLSLTKVIAMSGKLTDGQAQHLMHNGFDGYLKKPFHVRQVVETVEDAVAIVY